MKKLIAILMATLMIATLAACGSGSSTPSSTPDSSPSSETSGAPSSSEPQPADIDAAKALLIDPTKLIVGTSADFAPYEFHILKDGVDTIVGFDMALAQAIADKLGVELVIQDMNFDNVLMELAAGKIDMGLAGFSPDPDRMEVADFSELYYIGGQCLMIRKADADKYKSFADLKGLQVGAQTGSIQQKLLEANASDSTPVLLQAIPNIILELQGGKIEAAFMETVVAENYIKSYTDLAIGWDVPYEDAAGSAVALAKNKEALLSVVNEVVAEVLANGQMAQFIADANDLAGQSIS